VGLCEKPQRSTTRLVSYINLGVGYETESERFRRGSGRGTGGDPCRREYDSPALQCRKPRFVGDKAVDLAEIAMCAWPSAGVTHQAGGQEREHVLDGHLNLYKNYARGRVSRPWVRPPAAALEARINGDLAQLSLYAGDRPHPLVPPAGNPPAGVVESLAPVGAGESLCQRPRASLPGTDLTPRHNQSAINAGPWWNGHFPGLQQPCGRECSAEDGGQSTRTWAAGFPPAAYCCRLLTV